MDKIYQLLRNNQQSGPYTKEELIQLELKPFDLIWANGITAGWMYPTEIEVLKPYIAEVKHELVRVAEPIEPLTPSPAAPDVVTSTSKPVINQQVQVSSPGKHIFISLPGGSGIPKPAPIKKDTVTEAVEVEETPEQKLERKAMELRQKVQAFAAAKKDEPEEPTLDTKYARSLDDIKEEYTHWMHEQRHKGHRLPFTKKHWMVAAAVILLGSVGYLGIKSYSESQTTNPPHSVSQLPKSNPVIQPALLTPKTEPNNQSVIHTEYTERSATALRELEQANKLIEEDLKRFGSTTHTKPDKPISDHSWPEEQGETYAASGEPSTDEAVNPTSTEKPRSADPEVYPVSNRAEKKAVPLNQQIDVKANYLKNAKAKGLAGLELTLRNNSSQVIKTVAIDVFYYKEDNRLVDKETVYFNNVQPGESIVQTAPGNRKASSATYQLGLISTGNGLYVAKN
jgi:hypothetical protein